MNFSLHYKSPARRLQAVTAWDVICSPIQNTPFSTRPPLSLLLYELYEGLYKGLEGEEGK